MYSQTSFVLIKPHQYGITMNELELDLSATPPYRWMTESFECRRHQPPEQVANTAYHPNDRKNCNVYLFGSPPVVSHMQIGFIHWYPTKIVFGFRFVLNSYLAGRKTCYFYVDRDNSMEELLTCYCFIYPEIKQYVLCFICIWM